MSERVDPSDWDDFRLFLEVARGGGLALASKRTGKSPPTLGRRMTALEKRLGSDLFQRHARGYDLTEAGERLLAELSSIEAQLTPLLDRHTSPRPPLMKISAGTWMTYILCRHVDRIARDDVTIRFIAADHVLDIRHREAVIGLRNHRPEQIGLAGRRVGRVQFAVYGVANGVEAWARVVGTTPSAVWTEQNVGSAPVIEVTHSRNALDLALAGAARAVLPTFIGDDVEGIERLSDPIEELAHDQWLVAHHEDRFEPPVRRTLSRLGAVLEGLY
ncbi:MAG: LysR family transcriptional regulator [Pseudomonadota bacterium]